MRGGIAMPRARACHSVRMSECIHLADHRSRFDGVEETSFGGDDHAGGLATGRSQRAPRPDTTTDPIFADFQGFSACGLFV